MRAAGLSNRSGPLSAPRGYHLEQFLEGLEVPPPKLVRLMQPHLEVEQVDQRR
jgi:hypothetical protein